VRFHRTGVDQYLFDAKVGELGLIDVIFVVERHADAVDHLVPALFLDRRTYQARFVAVHVVLAQDLPDRINAGLDGGLVIGRAVLPQQVLQHIGGHDGIALDGFYQILAHHQAGEMLVDLVIKLGHGWSA